MRSRFVPGIPFVPGDTFSLANRMWLIVKIRPRWRRRGAVMTLQQIGYAPPIPTERVDHG